MKCRININGQKIWVDDNNKYATRPEYVDIELYRDDELVDTIRIDSSSDGEYRFPCLIKWGASKKYVYRVDETLVPDGYTKRIVGNNIINTLNEIEVEGVKTWVDNDDIGGFRPQEITLRLLRNGIEIESQQVTIPPAPENIVPFSFGTRPFADSDGVPFVYSIIEDEVSEYITSYNGFNITNTLGIIP